MADAGAKAEQRCFPPFHRQDRPAGAAHGFSIEKYYRLENTMNRTELTEGNPMSITAFSEAIGLRAAAQQTPVQPRTRRSLTPEQWDAVILAEAAARLRRAAPTATTVPLGETVQQPDPEPLRRALFESTLGKAAPSPQTAISAAVTKDEISNDIHRAEQSFAWREPVTVEEWVNGADGQYRSPFRQQ